MSRNTLLFLCAMLAIVVGVLVSYFPPPQNGVAIWSMVSMFVGYGIRDLYKEDASGKAAPVSATPTAPAAPTAEPATPSPSTAPTQS